MATAGGPPRLVYDYFVDPASNDPWTGKIQRWQERERNESHGQALPAVSPAPASVAEPGEAVERDAPVPASLHTKYASFRAEQRRAQAREVAAWIQEQAHEHYVPDGPVDNWATFAETTHATGRPTVRPHTGQGGALSQWGMHATPLKRTHDHSSRTKRV